MRKVFVPKDREVVSIGLEHADVLREREFRRHARLGRVVEIVPSVRAGEIHSLASPVDKIMGICRLHERTH
jgi:hypothetical protein